MTVNAIELRHTRSISSVASEIVCVVFAAIALLRTLIQMNASYEKEIQGNKQQLPNKRRIKRTSSRVASVARSSAKKTIVHGKMVRLPHMYFVLMLCLQVCFSDAFASSLFEETSSSSSSVIARTSTDVGQNDVPTMEEESGGMDGVTSVVNADAVDVASSNTALASDGVDGAATTTTMEMYREQITAQLQQTERLKHEVAHLRADRDQCRRTHAIENVHTMPLRAVDEPTSALTDLMTTPLPVAPPEVNTQTIQRRPTNITIVKMIDTTPMTARVEDNIYSSADSLLQKLQEALLLSPHVHHSNPVENIFLAANITAQCRTTTSREKSRQVQSKLNVAEGSKSTTTASSSSSSGGDHDVVGSVSHSQSSPSRVVPILTTVVLPILLLLVEVLVLYESVYHFVLYTFPVECTKKVKQACISAVHRCAPRKLFCYALLLLVVPRVLTAYMYEESLWSTVASLVCVALLLWLAVTVGVDGGFDVGSSASGWWCCHYQCGNDVLIVAKIQLWWRRSCVYCCCCGGGGGAGKEMDCDGGCCNGTAVAREVRESQFCRTTTKKLTKKKRDVFRVRLVPLLGNVMLLLLSMMIVVESFSPLPDGNGEHLPADRNGNTLNRIVDDWLDTNSFAKFGAGYINSKANLTAAGWEYTNSGCFYVNQDIYSQGGTDDRGCGTVFMCAHDPCSNVGWVETFLPAYIGEAVVRWGAPVSGGCRLLVGGTLVGSVAYPEKDITTRLNFNPGDKIRFEETTGLCGIFSVETTNKRPAVDVTSSNAGLTSRNVFDGVDGVDGAATTTTMEMYREQITAQLQQTERLKHEVAQLRTALAERDHLPLNIAENGHHTTITPTLDVAEKPTNVLIDPTIITAQSVPNVVVRNTQQQPSNTPTTHDLRPTNSSTAIKIRVETKPALSIGIDGTMTTTTTTTKPAADITAAARLLKRIQQDVLRRQHPNILVKPVEEIFLKATGSEILAQCNTQVKVKLNVVEGGAANRGGERLCIQLIRLQKEVVQVLAREEVERMVELRAVMEDVVDLLSTFLQRQFKLRTRELTSTTFGIGRRLKRMSTGMVEIGGRRRRLAACPTTIYKDVTSQVEATGGWNVWSASCDMSTTHVVLSGETVKIKKSAAMLGELVIDRGSDTSGFGNRHFLVYGTLEMEDVTLKGGHAVSSFCSLSSL